MTQAIAASPAGVAPSFVVLTDMVGQQVCAAG